MRLLLFSCPRLLFKFPSYFLYCISLLDDSSVLQLYGAWCIRIMLNFSIVFLLQKYSLNIMTTIISLFWIESTNHRDHQLLFMVLVKTKNLQQSLQCTIGSTLFRWKKNAICFRISDSLIITILLLFSFFFFFAKKRSKICPNNFFFSRIEIHNTDSCKRDFLSVIVAIL